MKFILEYAFKGLIAIISSIALYTFNNFEKSFNSMQNNISTMKDSIVVLNTNFAVLGEKLVNSQRERDKLDKRIDNHEGRIQKLETK